MFGINHFKKSVEVAGQILNTITAYETTFGPASKTLSQLRTCASNEHLSHTVAYDLAKYWHLIDPDMPPQITVYDADGFPNKYTPIRLNSNHPGLVGFILFDPTRENPRLHIVFRGTKDNDSFNLDLESPAPGFATFHANAAAIMQQIKQIVTHLNKDCAISVSGHSLGGALAQLTMNMLLVDIADASTKQDSDNVLNRLVKKLTLNHKNSAGVAEITYAQSTAAAAVISKLTNGPKITVNIIRTGGDPVQLSGQTNILHDAGSAVADVVLFKNKGHEGWFTTLGFIATITGALCGVMSSFPLLGPLAAVGYLILTGHAGFKAHTMHHFKDREPDALDMQIFDNSSPEGSAIISAKLTNQPVFFRPVIETAVRLAQNGSTPSLLLDPRHNAPWQAVSREPSAVTVVNQELLIACCEAKIQRAKELSIEEAHLRDGKAVNAQQHTPIIAARNALPFCSGDLSTATLLGVGALATYVALNTTSKAPRQFLQGAALASLFSYSLYKIKNAINDATPSSILDLKQDELSPRYFI